MLVLVLGGVGAALVRRTQAAAVERHGPGFLGTTRSQVQHGAQVVDQALEAAGPQPTLRLIVHGVPRRQVMWHRTLNHAITNHVERPVEHLPQAVITLTGGLGQQRQVSGNQRLFFIADIGRVSAAGLLTCKAAEPAGP